MGVAKTGHLLEILSGTIEVLIENARLYREMQQFLSMHFLKKFATKLERPVARLTPEALETLMQFDWPGNVREPENEIERALTLAGDDREIKVEYLSERIKGSSENRVGSDETPTTLQEATVRLERKMVVEALRQTARILGLTRQGLLNKITRYEIEL